MEDIEKRFRIKSYGIDFATGRGASGAQFLMGLLCPDVVLYRFDPRGNLLGGQSRRWCRAAARINGAYRIDDPAFQEHIARQIASWQSEIGFVKGPIEVCAFFDGDKYVGVGPPEDQDCHHVLWWAKDYWLSENGDVEST